jgi:hypothetical protein
MKDTDETIQSVVKLTKYSTQHNERRMLGDVTPSAQKCHKKPLGIFLLDP